MKYTDVIRLRKIAAETEAETAGVQQPSNKPWTRDQRIGALTGAGIGTVGGSLFGTSLANSFRDLSPAARLAIIAAPAVAGGALGGVLGYNIGTDYKNYTKPQVQVEVKGSLLPDVFPKKEDLPDVFPKKEDVPDVLPSWLKWVSPANW